jgi:homeobox protein cut-like
METFGILIQRQDIDLAELQRTLDAQGLEVVENQKESVVGRKVLADKTKGTLLSLYAMNTHGLLHVQTSEGCLRTRNYRRSRDCSNVSTTLCRGQAQPAYSPKAYQTEIDSLTKRAKVAENAFLSAYKVLAEAPDPYPLLETAIVRCCIIHPEEHLINHS